MSEGYEGHVVSRKPGTANPSRGETGEGGMGSEF